MGADYKPKAPEKVTLRHRVNKDGGERFAVYVGNKKVTAWATNQADADEMLRKASKNYRACMNCRGQFMSSGPQNRLCDRCRNLNQGMQ